MTRSILDKIHELGIAASDPHMDGFYNLEAKKKLYQAMRAIEEQLSRCPVFVTEKEWLEENQPKGKVNV